MVLRQLQGGHGALQRLGARLVQLPRVLPATVARSGRTGRDRGGREGPFAAQDTESHKTAAGCGRSPQQQIENVVLDSQVRKDVASRRARRGARAPALLPRVRVAARRQELEEASPRAALDRGVQSFLRCLRSVCSSQTSLPVPLPSPLAIRLAV